MIKGKEATFDAYVGFSEDYLVIVPCEKEMWYYRISQMDKCDIKKNWVGAYVCKMEFDNGGIGGL